MNDEHDNAADDRAILAKLTSPVTWEVQIPEVAPGGDVGGDYQAGEAWSVRLTSPQVPGSLIDVYVFAEITTDYRKPGPYHVQVMIKYLTCTDTDDPGSTETWSDYVYDSTADPRAYADDGRADDAAKHLAAQYAALPHRFTWDGKPFYHYEDRPRVNIR